MYAAYHSMRHGRAAAGSAILLIRRKARTPERPVHCQHCCWHRRRAAVRAWLQESADWSTPLHHASVVPIERTRALLRAGADLHTQARPGAPQLQGSTSLRSASLSVLALMRHFLPAKSATKVAVSPSRLRGSGASPSAQPHAPSTCTSARIATVCTSMLLLFLHEATMPGSSAAPTTPSAARSSGGASLASVLLACSAEARTSSTLSPSSVASSAARRAGTATAPACASDSR